MELTMNPTYLAGREDKPLSVAFFVALGNKVLKEAGKEACLHGYGTDDPEWVGRYAIKFGDYNLDGTSN